ncbi:FAR1-related protein [Striga asiatica]|uniref:FAR1-related protein n=1 Tax=Striga asiatica TaxID=4170 RepID=A0A5A7Q7Y7_STRAF|nr:FAR1-related protein [Striga asiatica]
MSIQKFVAHSKTGDVNDEDTSRSFDDQINTSLADGCEACNDYIPQVALASIPHENQSFRTLDEVKDFYIAYSKESGFSVREKMTEKTTSKKSYGKCSSAIRKGRRI